MDMNFRVRPSAKVKMLIFDNTFLVHLIYFAYFNIN